MYVLIYSLNSLMDVFQLGKVDLRKRYLVEA